MSNNQDCHESLHLASVHALKLGKGQQDAVTVLNSLGDAISRLLNDLCDCFL
jgi:hypothetical protein